ncbi:hypothetical protein LE181_01920 [Streptomyces sp. SCA3-4]|uniref:hypothetical protein n=1 Tax=Streptomyces sichuanensis TaxID=2871810 RepID=UPI001CE3980B|nr:hypothetical protein [Streptomyces sichuanensis]MCA6090932.1 hypothetical protein [Streptomyces sichuanensis]
MRAVDPGPVMIGIIVITLSILALALLVMWWAMPSPRRAFTPPPVGVPGMRFRCYCHEDPITVIVLASPEHEQQLAARARRQRRHRRHARLSPRRLWHRSRPASTDHEGAGGTGRGRSPAPAAL